MKLIEKYECPLCHTTYCDKKQAESHLFSCKTTLMEEFSKRQFLVLKKLSLKEHKFEYTVLLRAYIERFLKEKNLYVDLAFIEECLDYHLSTYDSESYTDSK